MHFLNVVCNFVALFLCVGFIFLGCPCLEQLQVIRHCFSMSTVFYLLVRLFLIDGCEEVDVDWCANSLCLDTCLNATEGEPLRVVGAALELIYEFGVFDNFHMLYLVFISLFITSCLLLKISWHYKGTGRLGSVDMGEVISGVVVILLIVEVCLGSMALVDAT